MSDTHPLIALSVERLGKFLGRPFTEAELDQPYDALGADSMDMVVLAFELEKHLGQRVEPELFLQHPTIRQALDDLIAR